MSVPCLVISSTLELIGRLDGDSFSDEVLDAKGNRCSLFTTGFRGFLSIKNPNCGAVDGSNAVYKLTVSYRNRHVKMRVAGTYNDLCYWLRAAMKHGTYGLLLTSPELAVMAGVSMYWSALENDWISLSAIDRLRSQKWEPFRYDWAKIKSPDYLEGDSGSEPDQEKS